MSPAVSKAQAISANIAHGIQQGKIRPKNGTASAEMAKSMSPSDIKKFSDTSQANLPYKKEHSIGHLISQFNEYGRKLSETPSLREIAEDLMQIAEFAEYTLQNESDDWFDSHTIARNTREVKAYVKEFAKIAEEHDKIRQRATALYDDMGRVLERYFEIQDDNPVDAGYDTDDDGMEDLQIGNTPKLVDPTHRAQMAHEIPGITDNNKKSPMDDPMEAERVPPYSGGVTPPGDAPAHPEEDSIHNKEMLDRLMKLARGKLTAEQLITFDQLPLRERSLAAWKVIDATRNR